MAGARAASRRAPSPRAVAPRRPRALLWALPLLLALLAGGAFVLASRASADRPAPIDGAAAALAPIQGVPSEGLVLGRASAPVTLVEYADLRCPACAVFDVQVLPDVIARHVRSGRLRVQFVPWTILGPQSDLAHRALLAAALQGRAWSFLSLFYANQGPEDAEYVTRGFLRGIAAAAGADVDRLMRDMDRPGAFSSRLAEADAAASRLALGGTPSFLVSGPGGRYVLPAGVPDPAALDRAIRSAAG
jgi:protein-disulfide isomerase